MAKRELRVVISKKSRKQVEKAIEKIGETGSTLQELKIGKTTKSGVTLPVLRILVEV